MEEWKGMPVVQALAEDFRIRLEKLTKDGKVPTLAVIRV